MASSWYGEREFVAQESLQLTDCVVALLAADRSRRAARLDHLVQHRIIGAEVGGEGVVVRLLADMDGRHEAEDYAVVVLIEDLGGFETRLAVVALDKAEKARGLFRTLSGGGGLGSGALE